MTKPEPPGRLFGRGLLFATAMLLIVISERANAQVDSTARVDSIMRGRDDLFDTQPDTSVDGRIPPAHPYPPSMWAPEFLARFERRELLGLRDRLFFVAYDRADGLQLTAGADLPMSLFNDERLQGHVAVGYSLGSHYWQVSGGLRRDFFDDESALRLGVEGHHFTDTRDAWKVHVIENSLFALIAGGDARDYFRRTGFSTSLEKFVNARTSIGVEYRRDTYESLQRNVAWSIFGPEQPFREVPRVREGLLESVGATFQSDYMSLRSWSEPQFGIAAHLEFGSSADRDAPVTNENRDWSFQSYIVDARLKAIVFPRLLAIALHMRAAAATGNAPPQRMFSIGGVGTVTGYPQNEYSGDRLLLVRSDLVIQPIRNGFLRNARIIISNEFGVIAFADAADRDNPLSIIGVPINDWKYSPGIYFGTPNARLRIGVAWRTDINDAPRFVLRISETF